MTENLNVCLADVVLGQGQPDLQGPKSGEPAKSLTAVCLSNEAFPICAARETGTPLAIVEGDPVDQAFRQRIDKSKRRVAYEIFRA